MKTCLTVILALAASITVAEGQTIDNKKVVEMKEKGVSIDLIIEAIQSTPEAHFTFSTDDFDAFSKANLGPVILKAMYERSKQPIQVATPKPQSKTAVDNTPAPKRQPSATPANAGPSDEEFLHAGTNEFGLTAEVSVPHSSTSGTIGYFALDYQRYLKPWFSVGPSVGGIFLGSGFVGAAVHEIDLLGNAQFSPKIGGRTYLVAGGGAGVDSAAGGGASSTHFVIQAFAGPRTFVSRRVALDIRYVLSYIRIPNVGFKYSSSSSLTAGLSFFF